MYTDIYKILYVCMQTYIINYNHIYMCVCTCIHIHTLYVYTYTYTEINVETIFSVFHMASLPCKSSWV